MYVLRPIGLIMTIIACVLIESRGYMLATRRHEFLTIAPLAVGAIGVVLNLFPYPRKKK